jgi:hypothetical protein
MTWEHPFLGPVTTDDVDPRPLHESSSAFRFTAAGAVFYGLSQSGDRPERPILLSVRPPIPSVPS